MKKIPKGSLKIFSSQMKFFRKLAFCRVCGGDFEEKSLTLKDSPLANELYSDRESALSADTFPLEIVMCRNCSHIQLRHIVTPERLFSNYVYASGTSLIFREHFQQLALKLRALVKNGKVLEIGSNDGTLLDSLVDVGFEVVGVEPSYKLTQKCIERGLEVHTDFLNYKLTKHLKNTHKEFDLIVGNNVFAHIDDLPTALQLVNSLLKSDGYLVFEVAHSLTMVTELLFDTIYHEHMSYHSAHSLAKFLPHFGFKMVEIEEIDMHGGSLRVICQKVDSRLEAQSLEGAMLELIQREKLANLDSVLWMETFEKRLVELKSDTYTAMTNGAKEVFWFGYGAPAKAVTFINEFNLDLIEIAGIVDDNTEKQNRYLPGSGIKVLSRGEMINKLEHSTQELEYRCIIFPWNLSDEIVGRLEEFSKFKVMLVWFLPYFKKVELVK
jgi:2-polyprenyl-3-methyl-5-hydroxy-6-metoxy-1,4-benzoquinol methylase